jgi:hypothetical protein
MPCGNKGGMAMLFIAMRLCTHSDMATNGVAMPPLMNVFIRIVITVPS